MIRVNSVQECCSCRSGEKRGLECSIVATKETDIEVGYYVQARSKPDSGTALLGVV